MTWNISVTSVWTWKPWNKNTWGLFQTDTKTSLKKKEKREKPQLDEKRPFADGNSSRAHKHMLSPREQNPPKWKGLHGQFFLSWLVWSCIIHDCAWLLCILQSYLHVAPSCNLQEFPQPILARFHGVALIPFYSCRICLQFHSKEFFTEQIPIKLGLTCCQIIIYWRKPYNSGK